MSVFECCRIRPLGRINVPEHSPCALRAQGHINMLRLPQHRVCVHSKEHTPLNTIFSRFKTLCTSAKVFILFPLKVSQIENLTKITYRISAAVRPNRSKAKDLALLLGRLFYLGVYQRGRSLSCL